MVCRMCRCWRVVLFLGVLLGVAVQPRPVSAEGRVALVVGNSEYASEGISTLRNPRNDARAVGAAFGRLGFDVTMELDADVSSLQAALRQFTRRTTGAEMAVVFYSGHGVEVAGNNYLVPVDATPEALRYAVEHGRSLDMVSLDDVLGAVAGARLRVVILDACRNSPISGGERRRDVARSITRIGSGLGGLDGDVLRDGETLVAYAAAAGTTAADGDGPYSPYTDALLKELETKQGIFSMFGAVRRRVLEATDRRQRPHEYHSLLNDYFLSGPPPSERERQERVFWQSIQDSSDPADLEAYLAAWPAGIYAPLVRNRLARLRPRPSDPGSPDTPSPGFRNRLRAADVERLTMAAGQGDARALERLRQAAAANQVDAQAALGGLYDSGRGVSQDYAEAAAWYLRAAERGDAGSQNSLGAMYQRGQGVVRDDRQAARWFRRAADQGHALAQRNLGVLYSTGQGVPRDQREAAAWYRRAADQGNAHAQFGLGVMFSLGEGVARNAVLAAAWYRKAADQGHAYAQTNLGVLYNDGRGVPRDAVEAASWYRKASEQGFATAQYYLGLSHRDGRGVARDAVSAHMWFGIAAANGMNRARAARAAMEWRMTPAQIARSNSRGSTCVQSGYEHCGYSRPHSGSLPFGLGTLARP